MKLDASPTEVVITLEMRASSCLAITKNTAHHRVNHEHFIFAQLWLRGKLTGSVRADQVLTGKVLRDWWEDGAESSSQVHPFETVQVGRVSVLASDQEN